jgi:PAS domain S-box-containing protein
MKLKKPLNVRSFRLQAILSSAALVILTACAVGLPALWIGYQNLERETCDRCCLILQGLYSGQKTDIANLAHYTSHHSALSQILEEPGNLDKVLELYNLKEDIDPIDMVAVCDADGQVAAQTDQTSFNDLCVFREDPDYSVVIVDSEPQAWLLGTSKIYKDNLYQGLVVVGIEMDRAFLLEMSLRSGLEHTLFFNSVPIGSSFNRAELASIHRVPLRNSESDFRSQFKLDGRTYYTTGQPLNSSGLSVEVALDVSGTKQAQSRLIIILTGVIFSVTILAVALGAFMTRRVNQPLEQVVEYAANFGLGSLDHPVRVNTDISEVSALANAFENARVTLKGTLTSLQKEKEWGDQLLESIVEGIITLDDEGRISYFSPGAERITGWLRSEVMGKPVDTILKTADESTSFRSQIPPVGEKNRLSVLLKNEKRSILSVTHAELPPSDAGESSEALVFRDISEEEALSRLLGHFMANIAHEFRTPLSALAASIELLLVEIDQLTKSEIQDLTNTLYLGILNLETLIDNLLEGASIETGQFRVFPAATGVREIIAASYQVMDPLLKKYEQPLIIDLPDQLPYVGVDKRRIVQVVVNLLSNASRYAPSKTEIKLSVRELSDWVEVSVSDQGPGIPEAYRDKLFSGSLLTRIEDGLMRKGAGLGLSVVNAIVKAHDGEVGVRENEGGGSIFWFTIPIAGER